MRSPATRPHAACASAECASAECASATRSSAACASAERASAACSSAACASAERASAACSSAACASAECASAACSSAERASAERDPLPPVCILAGGLGTRLGERVREVPKPLLEVAGEPFLIHQLRRLAAHHARRVVICVGYRGEAIVERIGHTRFDIDISYSHDDPGLSGTLGAIRKAAPLLGERFLILYGDSYLRVDYTAAARAWRGSGLPALMTVLRNEGRWDASNVLYRAGRVIAYDKDAPTAAMRWIDYGLGGLCSRALSAIPASERDLASLYRALAQRRELCGFAVSARFYEIGTPAALAETEAFLGGGPDQCGTPSERGLG